MRDLVIEIEGKQYDLSTTLRVAYDVQKQHNHKSYVEILSNVDTMLLEEQIGIIYAAFKVANPFDAKTITRDKFLETFLDNYTLKDLTEYMKVIVSGILGTSDEDDEDDADTDGNSGN